MTTISFCSHRVLGASQLRPKRPADAQGPDHGVHLLPVHLAGHGPLHGAPGARLFRHGCSARTILPTQKGMIAISVTTDTASASDVIFLPSLYLQVRSGVGSLCGSPMPLRKTIAVSQAAKAAVAAAGKKYTFANVADNSCVDHSSNNSFTELPKEFLRDIRRPSHFQV